MRFVAKACENGLVVQVCLVCLVCLVEQNQFDELIKPDRPDEPDRRFTYKNSGSTLAAEAFMNNAG
jgi:CubicO group peptidase (beta-lactamase class C family)